VPRAVLLFRWGPSIPDPFSQREARGVMFAVGAPADHVFIAQVMIGARCKFILHYEEYRLVYWELTGA